MLNSLPPDVMRLIAMLCFNDDLSLKTRSLPSLASVLALERTCVSGRAAMRTTGALSARGESNLFWKSLTLRVALCGCSEDNSFTRELTAVESEYCHQLELLTQHQATWASATWPARAGRLNAEERQRLLWKRLCVRISRTVLASKRVFSERTHISSPPLSRLRTAAAWPVCWRWAGNEEIVQEILGSLATARLVSRWGKVITDEQEPFVSAGRSADRDDRDDRDDRRLFPPDKSKATAVSGISSVFVVAGKLDFDFAHLSRSVLADDSEVVTVPFWARTYIGEAESSIVQSLRGDDLRLVFVEGADSVFSQDFRDGPYASDMGLFCDMGGQRKPPVLGHEDVFFAQCRTYLQTYLSGAVVVFQVGRDDARRALLQAFPNGVELRVPPLPDLYTRFCLLLHHYLVIEEGCREFVDLADLALRTEGYTARMIVQSLSRVTHAALGAADETLDIIFTQEMFERNFFSDGSGKSLPARVEWFDLDTNRVVSSLSTVSQVPEEVDDQMRTLLDKVRTWFDDNSGARELAIVLCAKCSHNGDATCWRSCERHALQRSLEILSNFLLREYLLQDLTDRRQLKATFVGTDRPDRLLGSDRAGDSSLRSPITQLMRAFGEDLAKPTGRLLVVQDLALAEITCTCRKCRKLQARYSPANGNSASDHDENNNPLMRALNLQRHGDPTRGVVADSEAFSYLSQRIRCSGVAKNGLGRRVTLLCVSDSGTGSNPCTQELIEFSEHSNAVLACEISCCRAKLGDDCTIFGCVDEKLHGVEASSWVPPLDDRILCVPMRWYKPSTCEHARARKRFHPDPVVAFVVDDFLSRSECDELRERARLQFREATVNVGGGERVSARSVRQSLQCDIDAPDLTREWFSRLRDVLPQKFLSHELDCLNPRMHFLKYENGGYFMPHEDGHYAELSPCDDGGPGYLKISLLTIQLYLTNGGGEENGGRTRFLDAQNDKHYSEVRPLLGRALIFEQSLLHEGARFTATRSVPTKETVRLEVLYRPPSSGSVPKISINGILGLSDT